MATNSTSTGGTISVPMSSILDALGTELSAAERATLLQQLVGFRINEVRPGDLIKAELFNQMLGDINELAIRIAKLEGVSGGPILDTIQPNGVPIPVNTLMAVVGRNFNPEPRANIVHIGNVAITQFRDESTATTLYFPVPDLFSNLPATFPVSVETAGRVSNVIPVSLKSSQQIQQGAFAVKSVTQPTGNVVVGAVLAFTWSIEAITVLHDELTLSLSVTEAQGASAEKWVAVIQPGPTLPIDPGEKKMVSVSVTVPQGATAAKLALRAVAKDGVLIAASDPIAVALNAPIELSDPRIDIGFSLPSTGGGQVRKGTVTIADLAQDGLLVRKSQTGTVKFSVTDKRVPGAGVPNANFTYAVEIQEAQAPANGFVIGTPNPAGDTGVAAGNERIFNLSLGAPGVATAGATARLKVTCQQTAAPTYKAYRIIPLKIID